MNIIKRLLFHRNKLSDQRPAPVPEVAQTTDGNNYSTDQPIRSKSEDRFNRWPFAERIAQTIAVRLDPSSIVVGLYGAWGEGKSSVLAMMEEALAGRDNIVCVRFNPWYFKTEEQLLRSFFSVLAKAIGKSLPTKAQEIGNALDKYGSILSLTSLIPGAPNPTAAVQGIGRAISATELDGLRNRIESLLRDAKKRVVILIDDIDRLDRHEIQTTFKLVKLSANFEHTTYVLAFDDKMVSDALGENYGGGGSDAGRSFLEKIVQVPLQLPPADALELRRLVFEGVDASLKASGIELSEDQVQAFIRHFVDGIDPQLGTPRQAKLYTNALAFALPLMKGEVNPVDQMLIEGIRVFYPPLYATIRDNPDAFAPQEYVASKQPFRDRTAKLVNDVLVSFDTQHADSLRNRLLCALFPRLESVFRNTVYGTDWDKSWENEQRVCSKSYFDRYFRYGVMPGDVSDVALSLFLDRLATATNEAAINELFEPFSKGDRLGRLVAKLRLRKERLDPATAIRLANVLGKNGSNLPRERAMLISDWSFMQAGILIVELLRCVPEGQSREDAARTLLAQIGHLPFAFECLRWMHSSKKEGDEELLINEAAVDQLEKGLADRIRDAACEAPLYKTFGSDAPKLLFLWKKYETSGEVAKYLESRFATVPGEAEEFLVTFLGTAWGMESGLPQKADLDRPQYDSIAKLVDPLLVLAHLRKQYGAEIDGADQYQPQAVPQPKRASLQFAFCHRMAQQAPTDKAKEG